LKPGRNNSATDVEPLAKKVERPGNRALMLSAMNAAFGVGKRKISGGRCPSGSAARRHAHRANTADSRATEQVKYFLNQGLL
jgi:hypothetical protein